MNTFDSEVDITLSQTSRKVSVREPFVQVYEKSGNNEKNNNIEHINDSSRVCLPKPCFNIIKNVARPNNTQQISNSYYRHIDKSIDEIEEIIEYDMDEEDFAWLDLVNKKFKGPSCPSIDPETFEMLMDRFEKEAYFQNQSNTDDKACSIDDDAICSICFDGDCDNGNAILFCDMCNMAVHQDCYGVPYIPEGQWLCRRCLQSPSRAVDCCLCPNKGGAFKQTDKGLWAHVVCAIWIPEISFSNTVFLEPIEGIERISSARRKLTCYICKKRKTGACIQCSKAHCYLAFHVTCAQLAGLYMRIEPQSPNKKQNVEQPSSLIKKTAFCDIHSPSDSKGKSMVASESDSDENSRNSQASNCEEHMKKVRKILARKRNSAPSISIPTILPERLDEISESLFFPQKTVFLKRLLSYWKLKRRHHNGVPLLRRLQSNQMNRKKALGSEEPLDEKSLTEQLIMWQRLRQDFERVRLLLELIKKRERLKNDYIELSLAIIEMTTLPLTAILRWILNKLQEIDTQQIFAFPVSLKEPTKFLVQETNQHDIQILPA